MRYIIDDKKYRFRSAFDTDTGAYVRTGILDENGRDTGVDPLTASYPHLIDVGAMGRCIHGKKELCMGGCPLIPEIVFCDSKEIKGGKGDGTP